jgi:hypothetical protein
MAANDQGTHDFSTCEAKGDARHSCLDLIDLAQPFWQQTPRYDTIPQTHKENNRTDPPHPRHPSRRTVSVSNQSINHFNQLTTPSTQSYLSVQVHTYIVQLGYCTTSARLRQGSAGLALPPFDHLPPAPNTPAHQLTTPKTAGIEQLPSFGRRSISPWPPSRAFLAVPCSHLDRGLPRPESAQRASRALE